MELSIARIADTLSQHINCKETVIKHLLTDSRSLETPENTLFFAIPTNGNDGHRYMKELYDRGVRNFVANHIPPALDGVTDANFLLVPDTVAALQKIATRSKNFNGNILAITGSRGKTTLKEWIFQLMEPLSDISRSPRSYNSQIGVPLSMWELEPTTRLGVIEAGISRTGEMKALAECINPDTVIITNIGDAHSEGFSSLKSKAEEKAILATAQRTTTVIYSLEYPEIAEALANVASNVGRLTWSTKNKEADIFIKVESGKPETLLTYTYAGKTSALSAPLETAIDIENAAHALSFMLHSGYSPEVISERFRHLHKIGTRLNVSEGVNGCTLIRDSYTSDFSSLRPALDFLRRRKTSSQTSTLILSDIHHESGNTDTLYANIAELLRVAKIDRFIGVGPAMAAHSRLFPETALFFNNTKELTEQMSPSDFQDETILLKGSPEHSFLPVAEMLETRMHETVLEVNLDSIVSNFNYFRSHVPAGTGIVCMVKASGYGAGSYEIAKTLQDCGGAYLAVAVLDEGIELRRKGITMPIMVMNPKVVNYKLMFANKLEPEIYSFEMLRDVIREARKNGITGYPVHIKLDTGMHRMGFVESELSELMDILCDTQEVIAKSVFSHLATADCPDMDDYTELQLGRFREYTDYMLGRYNRPILRHVLNTAGILRYPEHHYDMVRLGIGLYGANTLPPEMESPLAVVSTLRTVIIAIRERDKGESIGYARKGMLTHDSRIATIPIGYADGMNRHFGNGAISVLVNGQPAPTVGNICMDACMIDVTGIDCKVGDSVEIFGVNAPLQRMADTLDTIPYEVLTSISPRVKRVYYRE
ncbi:MAG: bifunctional UDP-N-acetylmuramoyl-tripeptide:D-alanyl-D-alanine ligase/alanine racemase [Candidatus Amulumruptor caecigallinarius]|nr:bifunctional UDP-N-acetylmuramoyl-tripeptide:D-alanyl-D-alanine ligase/alanine racemase [Candidatus Amulumruptor caecigallinarius]